MNIWDEVKKSAKNPIKSYASLGLGTVTGGAVNLNGGGWAQGGNILTGATGVGKDEAPVDPSAAAHKLQKAQSKGAAEGREKGDILFGQDQATTGQKIQKGAALYEDRLNGTDPITEALKQQKQTSQANVARGFAGRGVAGGVAAAGMEQAGRQKDIDIAASAYAQNANNLKDYTNLHSNIAANQGMLENLYAGKAVSGVQLQPVQNQGGFLQSLFG